MFGARLTVRPETLAATRRPARAPGSTTGLIALQRKIGNKAMGRLVAAEASLKVDNDDALEREADRAADEVLATPEPVSALSAAPVQIGRKCAACEDEDEKKCIQRKPDGAAAPANDGVPASVHHTLRTPGRPLDASTRAYFEGRFGRDFSGVRVHADAGADASARAIDAEAYAVGERVVFAQGRYDPQSEAGRRLLAHELAHVVQQMGGRDEAIVRRQPKGRGKAPPRKDYGRVLFLFRSTAAPTPSPSSRNSGTLVYPLIELRPRDRSGWSYRFNVSFPELLQSCSRARRRRRIAATPASSTGSRSTKPKPGGSLCAKEKTVDVLVTDDGPGQGGGSASARTRRRARRRAPFPSPMSPFRLTSLGRRCSSAAAGQASPAWCRPSRQAPASACTISPSTTSSGSIRRSARPTGARSSRAPASCSTARPTRCLATSRRRCSRISRTTSPATR